MGRDVVELREDEGLETLFEQLNALEAEIETSRPERRGIEIGMTALLFVVAIVVGLFESVALGAVARKTRRAESGALATAGGMFDRSRFDRSRLERKR